MPELVLHISGMSCGHCLHAVNEALASHPGLHLESVRMGQAVVRYDDQITSPAAIEAAVAQAGYTATSAPATEAMKDQR